MARSNGIQSPGLIIPGVTPRDQALKGTIARHTAAMATMSPEQLDAVNRLVLATVMVVAQGGLNATPDTQRDIAQASLLEILRREARGVDTPRASMWTPRAMSNPWGDQLSDDHLAEIADRPVGDGEHDG